MTDKQPTVTFKRKRVVTLPLWKWKTNEPKFLKFTGEMFVGKEIKGGEAKKMEPATLAHVVDLTDGEEKQIIIGAVLNGVMDEEYPEGTYVDKGFEITQEEGTRRYKTYKVIELDLED